MADTFHKLAALSQVTLSAQTVREKHVNVNGLKRYLVRLPPGSLPLDPGTSFANFNGTPHTWSGAAKSLHMPKGKSVRKLTGGHLELWVPYNP